VPRPAEPDVAVISPAHDVVLVGGSIFVPAHVPIDVHTPIGVGVTSTVMAPTVMAASVMFATVVTSSMTSAVTFCVGRRPHSKSECCGDRKNETNLLQHFCFPPKSRHRTVAISS
jgi:hypothetical protein